MGWWGIKDENDCGLFSESKGDLCIGDAPADAMGAAIDEIRKLYMEEWDREPTKVELQACFNFVLGGLDFS